MGKILDRPLVDTMEDPILGSLEPRESAPLCWGRVSKKAIAWLATGQCVLIFALLVLCFGLIIHTTVDDDDAIQGTPSSPPAPSAPVDEESFYFFQLSDLHTDPYYENQTLPLAQYGEDGGPLLLQ